MKKLSVRERKLICENIQTDDSHSIILLDTTEDPRVQSEFGMENIFCIQGDDVIVWQVAPNKKASGLNDTFVYIKRDSNGDLIAGTFFGMEYLVDQKTGEATRIGFHK